METIIHKIKLIDSSKAKDYEDWVKNSDYVTCPQLKSLLSFDVHKISDSPKAEFHYFEIIKIKSHDDFQKDIRTTAFAKLVEAFDSMAEVVEEFDGTQVGLGYQRLHE